jgi:hypothetical protein
LQNWEIEINRVVALKREKEPKALVFCDGKKKKMLQLRSMVEKEEKNEKNWKLQKAKKKTIKNSA